MASGLPAQRVPVTVLGATGVVGQRFVQRLAQHPLFQVHALAASERSAGRPYGEACTWRIGGAAHGGEAEREVTAADPDAAMAPVVFSALDTAPARAIEPAFAARGALVFSNAGAFRMAEDVPLLVPEVNPSHLELLKTQRRQRGFASGGIITNANCTTTILVLALAPLHAAFGVEAVFSTSMQAISGAGYPGVASLDIVGNVVPHIGGEEGKVEAETSKILGALHGEAIEPTAFPVSAACHRVPVVDGHTLAVSVRLRGQPSPDEVADCLRAWRGEPQERGLHSAPPQPVRVHAAVDRPQPALDVQEDGGMSIHVGRIRHCPILGTKFTVLGHNTERGAAGGSLLNAELAHAHGLLHA